MVLKVCHSPQCEKNGRISFNIGKTAFFERFLSNDLLGPIELNLKLAEKL